MTEFNNAFNEYMEAFKALDIPDKRMEIINSVKEINAIIDNLAEKSKIYLGYLKSKEILDMKNGLESEDDFLEALLVYIENFKTLLAQYILLTQN